MKWMNAAAAATSYPTNGRGGVTATSTSSGFANSQAWDNLLAVVHGVVVCSGSAAGTVVISSHDASVVLETLDIPANASAYYIPLAGIELEGLRVVCAGAACTAMVFFETGDSGSYSAT